MINTSVLTVIGSLIGALLSFFLAPRLLRLPENRNRMPPGMTPDEMIQMGKVLGVGFLVISVVAAAIALAQAAG
jgi:hypothetical protein